LSTFGSSASAAHIVYSLKQGHVRKPLLELIDVTKRYPGVVANHNISFRVMAGEIRAVVGENGAGKSTLMKIIYGSEHPDEGQMIWEGREIDFEGPDVMRQLGIGMVFQHFALFESLTVLDNIILSMPDNLGTEEIRKKASEAGEIYGFSLSLDNKVGGLSVGERQQVEIIRCLLTDPKLLIFDEPTAVLPPSAINSLFSTIRQLAAGGCAILYISHKLAEIKQLCSNATVLRAGKLVGNVVVQDTEEADLAVLMTGRELPVYERAERVRGALTLQVSRLSCLPRTPEDVALHDISFSVFAGEIVGIAGVSGSGQRQLFELLSGERQAVESGAVLLKGQPIGALGVKHRRGLDMAYIPEERVGHGSLPDLTLGLNYLLSQAGTKSSPYSVAGFIRFASLVAATTLNIARFKVKAAGPSATAGTLSGGNIQKFIVGREISKRPTVLLVSQPTWGVDIASSLFIRQEITRLAANGAAVLVGSEDLDELLQVSDRIMVLSKGRLSPAIPTNEMTSKKLGLWMAGLFDSDALPATTNDSCV